MLLGGPAGNEILTKAVAAVLVVLLVAEGVTVIHMGGLVSAHMLIGVALLPPVALKLASTGYRFARYYTGARPYRAKGPPQLALRILAPALALLTMGVLGTGVWLLALGHRSGALIELHKVLFIVWVVLFGVHFLAYAPRVARSLATDWSAARRVAVPGAGLRATVVAGALGGGLALALALASAISAWHGGHHG